MPINQQRVNDLISSDNFDLSDWLAAGVCKAQFHHAQLAAAESEDDRMTKTLELADLKISQLSNANDGLRQAICRIISAIKPELVEVDGKTYEFSPPPETVYRYWSGLSAAIREAMDYRKSIPPDPRDEALRVAREQIEQLKVAVNNYASILEKGVGR